MVPCPGCTSLISVPGLERPPLRGPPSGAGLRAAADQQTVKGGRPRRLPRQLEGEAALPLVRLGRHVPVALARLAAGEEGSPRPNVVRCTHLLRHRRGEGSVIRVVRGLREGWFEPSRMAFTFTRVEWIVW